MPKLASPRISWLITLVYMAGLKLEKCREYDCGVLAIRGSRGAPMEAVEHLGTGPALVTCENFDVFSQINSC